ncbi:hypothetical protein ACQE98_03625 [Ornithinimicrobium sp. W1679]|uniref:hypothetical protein n=1 Tax=unclassified Ornithinimicrobium TaxID=2615080 RepID=UPI003CF4D320
MRDRTRLRRTLLGALAATLVVGSLLYLVGALPHSLPEVLAVVLLAGTVLGLLLAALRRTGDGVEPAWWASTPREEAIAPAAMDYRLVRLRRDLRDALERDDRPDTVHAVLHDLAAERLRALHGVDLAAQPDEARALTGPELWHYLTHPPTGTRRSSRGAVQTAIEGIEKL